MASRWDPEKGKLAQKEYRRQTGFRAPIRKPKDLVVKTLRGVVQCTLSVRVHNGRRVIWWDGVLLPGDGLSTQMVKRRAIWIEKAERYCRWGEFYDG